MDTEQKEQKSLPKVLIIVAIVVVFMVVIGVVIYALMVSGDKQAQTSSTKVSGPWPRVATKEEISQNLTDLNANLKQAKDDQAAANTAVKDNEKQIKVGN